MQRVARFTSFATLGTIGTTQEVAGTVLGSVEGADPELVAEETLCLVATATARAAEVGLKEEAEIAEALLPSLLDLPYTYRDYLVGGSVIVQGDASLLDQNRAVYQRLQKKMSFYTVHLPEGQFPGPRKLADKMGLWMGRISPPGLPESPTERLEKLQLVEALTTHLKLILAFGRQGQIPTTE